MKNWTKKITLLSLSALGILMADSANAQSYNHMNPYQRKMMQAMQAQAKAFRNTGYMFQQDSAWMDAIRRKHIYMEHVRQEQCRALAYYKSAQRMLEKKPHLGFRSLSLKRFPATMPVLRTGSRRPF